MPSCNRFLHLGFALQGDCLSEEVIVFLTKNLPKLFTQAKLTLKDVRYLGSRNIGQSAKISERMQEREGTQTAPTPPPDRG